MASSENKTFLEKFEPVIGGIKNKNSIIAGDFNYNLFNVQTHNNNNNNNNNVYFVS